MEIELLKLAEYVGAAIAGALGIFGIGKVREKQKSKPPPDFECTEIDRLMRLDEDTGYIKKVINKHNTDIETTKVEVSHIKENTKDIKEGLGKLSDYIYTNLK